MNKTIAYTKAFVAAVDSACNDNADWGIATPYLALQAAKAVSYTHLDVYKRQHHEFPDHMFPSFP